MAKRKSRPWRPDFAQLKIQESLWEILLAEDLGEDIGNTLPYRRQIRLEADPKRDLGDTFCHELLHALWYSTGFMTALRAMKAAGEGIDLETLDELHASTVGPALWSVLRGNRMRFDE